MFLKTALGDKLIAIR